ncbi:MAG: response regulator, partial [Dehalococcoidia bacterium]
MQDQELSIAALIVEDSENDAAFLVRELKKLSPRLETKRVDSGPELEAALAERSWDIILCDYNLPTFSAPKALALLQERGVTTPMIIVSGFVGEEAAVDAMKAGARDYVSKSNLVRLGPAVLREMEEAEHRRQHRQLEEELRQSQKLESIGRLAGGMAHDFNNLLTVIQGFAEMGLKSGSEPDAKYFGQILDASKSAAHLTSQLLTFSKRQQLKPEVINLNELIDQMQKMLRLLVTEDIEFETRLASDIGLVKVDRHQMQQVLINMVVNARDAMPGGGSLTLTTSVAPSPFEAGHAGDSTRPDCVMLSIVDTGTGMTDEVKARIFEPFFTTKELGKGSGLGLATCYGIVKQSNGEITVTSTVGSGTRFDIWLPSTLEPATLPKPLPSDDDQRRPAHGEETILVVEDQKSVRHLAVEALRSHGYTVLEAANGVEALETAQECGPERLRML